MTSSSTKDIIACSDRVMMEVASSRSCVASVKMFWQVSMSRRRLNYHTGVLTDEIGLDQFGHAKFTVTLHAIASAICMASFRLLPDCL